MRDNASSAVASFVIGLVLLGTLSPVAECQEADSVSRLIAAKTAADRLRNTLAQIDKQRLELIRQREKLQDNLVEAQKQQRLAKAAYVKLARESAAIEQSGRAVALQGA